MPIDGIGNMNAMPRARPFADAVADNTRRLMEHHGLKQKPLAEKSGVGQPTLSGLLSERPDAPKRNPRADTIDKLAQFFQVPAWALCIPDAPIDLLLSGQLQSVLNNLVAATPTGRQTILRVAEAEGRYAVIHDQATGTG